MRRSEPYTTADLIDRTLELLRSAASRVTAMTVLFTAAGTVSDAGMLGEDKSIAADIAISVASYVAQYASVRSSLHDIGCHLPARSRPGAFIVLVIVSTLAILVGMVLLVLPGLILLVRWWIAVPLLIGNDMTVMDSLRESLRETEDRFWPLLLVILPIWVPAIALMVVLAVYAPEGERGTIQLMAVNLAATVAMVVGWHSAVAAYSFSSSARAGLVQVFE